MRLKSNELQKAVRLALTFGAAATAVVAPNAFAQDDAEKLETVTVVGSRIKRTDLETSQPIFVVSREDLQKTGLTSIGDILTRLTSNGATLNTVFNNGGNGETRIDLRNLGANRTLVLVNGRRWVTSLDGAVDLNTIPISVIERIEVLKDGASAIYGSDAIAGVINITLRDNFDGAEASAYLGESEEGDGRTEEYNFTIGSSTDRASVVLNASYTKQEAIFAGDREISAVPLFGIGGNNVNVGASSTTPFGRFGRAGIPGTVTLIPGRSGNSPDDFKTFDLNTDGFNFAPDNYLATPQERTAVFAHARYAITDNINFHTTVLINERKSSQQLAAIPITLGPVFGNAITISADNVYNPFGVEVTRAQYRNTRLLRVFSQDVDTFYFSGGFDGGFDLWDRSFSWDVNYVYTDNERRDITSGQFDLNRIAAGTGPSFFDGQGVARCGTPEAPIDGCVPLDFFHGPDSFTQAMTDYAGVTLQDTFYKKQYDYTANLTGDLFELPAGALGFAAGYEYRREFGYDQPDAITASGATTGNARAPTSGGFSLDEFYVEFNIPILKDLAFAEVLEFNVAARYSDYSNFGDTVNPKFGFRWKPLADVLVRGNYAEGFRAPNVSELFGGNSDNFPNIADPCDGLSAESTGSVADRCRAGLFGVGPVPNGYEQANNQIRTTVGGNPNLQPENARSKTLGVVYSPSWVEGLDLYLDWYNIEVTDAISTPTAQFIANDCYVNNNAASCALITRGPGGEILDLFAGTNNQTGGLEVEGWDFTVDYRWDTNFGKFRANWDTAYVSYIGDVGQRDQNFCASINQPGGGSGVITPDTQECNLPLASGNQAGTSFDRGNLFSRIKSNINLNWTYGDFGATAAARYIQGVDESCALPVLFGFPELCSDPNVEDRQFADGDFPAGGPTNHMDDTWYFDLQGTWDSPWNARVTAGIRNLFDEDPPTAYSNFANSFDPQYDVPGRFWYVQYSQKF
jgi:iron complex outermembrane recepter protein